VGGTAVKCTETIRRYLGWCPDPDSFAPVQASASRIARGGLSGQPVPHPGHAFTLALVLLLPLPSALIFTAYSVFTMVLLPSTELQTALKLLVVAIPSSTLIVYGWYTRDSTGSALAGVLLVPLFWLYVQVPALLPDPGFMPAAPVAWANPDLYTGFLPFALLFGAAGILAARRTVVSLLLAIAAGAVAAALVLAVH
jgi:hypothetical protein